MGSVPSRSDAIWHRRWLVWDSLLGPSHHAVRKPRPHGETTGRVFWLTGPSSTARNVSEDTFKVTPVPATLTETTWETLSDSCLAESSQPPKPLKGTVWGDLWCTRWVGNTCFLKSRHTHVQIPTLPLASGMVSAEMFNFSNSVGSSYGCLIWSTVSAQ